jgi:cullin 1
MAAPPQQREAIIELEEGYQRIKREGIDPFVRLIETREREFFKAKDFVALYDLIFKMCIQREPYNYSAQMYDRYSEAIRDYLRRMVVPQLQEARVQYETTFLRQWVEKWANHQQVVRGLSKLFMYLDRFYTPNTDGKFALKEQGFRLYKEIVYDHFASIAREFVLNAVRRERDGEEQERQLLRETVSVFIEIGFSCENGQLKLYTNDVEKPLLRQTGDYYRRMARLWLDNDSCPTYLEKVENVLASERKRVEHVLNPSTLDPLLRECYNQLLKQPQLELLRKASGLFHLLETQRTADLSRLFQLYSRQQSDLPPIADMFRDYVKETGNKVMERESKAQEGAGGVAPAPAAGSASSSSASSSASAGPAAPPGGAPAAAIDSSHALVRALIETHEQLLDTVKSCFGSNALFHRALRDGFEAFVNQDNRVSKVLARFANDVLKKHSTVASRDVNATLDSIVCLYGYLTDKDVFERDYQRYLANRLLLGLCESEHHEKAMITKLKTECGYQWTNRLEGMFRDVQISRELQLAFRQIFDTERSLGLALEVNVCTTGYWPQSRPTPGNLPRELAEACEKFRGFYLGKKSGQKLEWHLDQGQAEVQVVFAPGTRRFLVCSTYQMLILLAFNTSNKPVSYGDILRITGLPPAEAAAPLLSLAHPKVQVLLKNPNVKELEEAHLFMINPRFTSTSLKVQIPTFHNIDEGKKKNEEDESINLQRQHQADAAIVRIMKTRKRLRHNQLVTEVVQQLQARFKPLPMLIKKRIEALIEQEYLKRDDNDRDMYEYLA